MVSIDMVFSVFLVDCHLGSPTHYRGRPLTIRAAHLLSGLLTHYAKPFPGSPYFPIFQVQCYLYPFLQMVRGKV